MPLPLDGPGWGVEHRLDAIPVAHDSVAAERCRQLAWWHLVEARWGRGTTLDLVPDYRIPEKDRGQIQAMGRLLGLLRELVDTVLPCLERAVRCEAVGRSRWSRTPCGGRVDVLRTLQASPLYAGAPEHWSVVEILRHADTPVNRFAAAVLRHSERLLDAIVARFHHGGRSPPGIVGSCHRSLRRFLQSSPLGSIPIDAHDDPDERLGHAHRRRAELERLGPLVRWWHELRVTDLVALHESTVEGLGEVSLHGCYELMHAMALVGALRMRFPGPAQVVDGRLQIGVGGGETVQLRFDEWPLLAGRPPTAVIRVARSTGERVIYIEARNANSATVGPVAMQLMAWCRDTRHSSAALVLPAAPTALAGLAELNRGGVHLVVDPLLDSHSMPDLVVWWSRLLAQWLS